MKKVKKIKPQIHNLRIENAQWKLQRNTNFFFPKPKNSLKYDNTKNNNNNGNNIFVISNK